jgi:predicted transcriptional regulator
MLHSNMVLVIDNVKNELELAGRHIRIMRLVGEQGPLGILKISKITEIPNQRVRYTLRVLQQSGFLHPTTKGAELNGKGYKFLKDISIEKKRLIEKVNRL